MKNPWKIISYSHGDITVLSDNNKKNIIYGNGFLFLLLSRNKDLMVTDKLWDEENR